MFILFLFLAVSNFPCRAMRHGSASPGFCAPHARTSGNWHKNGGELGEARPLSIFFPMYAGAYVEHGLSGASSKAGMPGELNIQRQKQMESDRKVGWCIPDTKFTKTATLIIGFHHMSEPRPGVNTVSLHPNHICILHRAAGTRSPCRIGLPHELGDGDN
ncbi:hypothetical protein BC835DRAFT_490403 [Cytidiella melzeri]|nr:hypothetical protein BC835DRAFT_490403 [Cytidiella melzeri]